MMAPQARIKLSPQRGNMPLLQRLQAFFAVVIAKKAMRTKSLQGVMMVCLENVGLISYEQSKFCLWYFLKIWQTFCSFCSAKSADAFSWKSRVINLLIDEYVFL